MATVKKSKKGIIIPICIVLVIAIAAGSIFAISKRNKSIEVTLETITTGDIYETISATGAVSSGSKKEYKVSTVATVDEVYVAVGDVVKKGDKLVSFNITQLDQQVNSLQASYDASVKSYNEAVKAQNDAKTKAQALKKQIDALNKNISKIESNAATTKKAATTAKSKPKTTAKKASKTTKKSKSSSNSMSVSSYNLAATPFTEQGEATSGDDTTGNEQSSTSTTAPSITKPSVSVDLDKLTTSGDKLTTSNNSSPVSDISASIKELTDTIASVTDDLDTIATITDIVGSAIAEALASGQIDSEVIADLVGQAVSQAITDGIIDSTKIMVENDVAVNMIEAAVRNIDFEAITESYNVAMTSSQLQLASLTAQYELYNTLSNGTLVNAQKSSMDANKQALDVMVKQRDALKDGWKADFDGTITEMSVVPGADTNMISTGLVLENLDSLVATISLGEYDIHKVKVGMECVITTAYGSYNGSVLTIAPTATGGSSNSILDNVGSMAGISGLSSLTGSGAGVLCTVEIENPDENIIAGFDADVEIHTGEYLGVVQVPIESLKLEKTGAYVYLYDDAESTVTKTPIKTGAISDSSYQVLEGLKDGDKIIATPSADYEEDTFKVKVVTK